MIYPWFIHEKHADFQKLFVNVYHVWFAWEIPHVNDVDWIHIGHVLVPVESPSGWTIKASWKSIMTYDWWLTHGNINYYAWEMFHQTMFD